MEAQCQRLALGEAAEARGADGEIAALVMVAENPDLRLVGLEHGLEQAGGG